MPNTDIDKAIHLVKLAQLHNSCSFDLDLEIHHTIAECEDLGYLAEQLAPLLASSIQNMQSFQRQLRSFQRHNPPKSALPIDKISHL